MGCSHSSKQKNQDIQHERRFSELDQKQKLTRTLFYIQQEEKKKQLQKNKDQKFQQGLDNYIIDDSKFTAGQSSFTKNNFYKQSVSGSKVLQNIQNKRRCMSSYQNQNQNQNCSPISKQEQFLVLYKSMKNSEILQSPQIANNQTPTHNISQFDDKLVQTSNNNNTNNFQDLYQINSNQFDLKTRKLSYQVPLKEGTVNNSQNNTNQSNNVNSINNASNSTRNNILFNRIKRCSSHTQIRTHSLSSLSSQNYQQQQNNQQQLQLEQNNINLKHNHSSFKNFSNHEKKTSQYQNEINLITETDDGSKQDLSEYDQEKDYQINNSKTIDHKLNKVDEKQTKNNINQQKRNSIRNTVYSLNYTDSEIMKSPQKKVKQNQENSKKQTSINNLLSNSNIQTNQQQETQINNNSFLASPSICKTFESKQLIKPMGDSQQNQQKIIEQDKQSKNLSTLFLSIDEFNIDKNNIKTCKQTIPDIQIN